MRRIVLALLFAVQATAQVQEHITVERIIVDTRVTDDRGNPVTGLKASDFRVRIDGTPPAPRRHAPGRRKPPPRRAGRGARPAAVESSEGIPETAAARELAAIDSA